MYIAAFFAALAGWLCARALAKGVLHRQRGLDEVCGSLRKVHVRATPRVGGVAVATGVVGGALAQILVGGEPWNWLLLLVCVAPAFLWGLIEDLMKRDAVLVRLALTAMAGVLGFVVLDARIAGLDLLPFVDDLLAIHAISFIFTVFAVTGVTHSINVIDGLNGLAGMTALLASIGLAMVAWITGDSFILGSVCILAASVGGFLLVNFPRGRIFLGDGGAYLVGLLLAELAVLLVHRNSEVSAWFPLMLLAYPVWETLFSIYRRRLRGHSPGHADALHLHSLVYRRIARWRGYKARSGDYVTRNSIASMCVWILPASCWFIAVVFWNNSRALQIGAVLFAVVYVWIYVRIVRFGVPSWIIITAGRDRTTEDDDTVDARR